MRLLQKDTPVSTPLVGNISTIAKSAYDAIESALNRVSQTTDQSSGRFPQWLLNHKLNDTTAQLYRLAEGMQDIGPDHLAEGSDMYIGPSDHMSSASTAAGESDRGSISSGSSDADGSIFSNPSHNTSNSSVNDLNFPC
jgi:hypothetical protein